MIVELKENFSGGETPFKTVLEYSKTQSELIFNFTCFNSKLFSAFSEYNAPIYKGDVCEVFLCVGEDLSEYYEIEVAPNGTVFFAKIKNDGKLNVTFLPNLLKTSAKVTDVGYNVEIVVPFGAIGVSSHPIRFNAFRIETEGGIPDKNLLSLSPTLCGNFHKPEKFILLEV